MDADHPSDEWLMREVARGKREQVTPLLRRWASPLLTFIERMIGDRHRSEELVQEVFLAVWTGRCKYEYPRPFRCWLFGIAMNKCRTEFRRTSAPPVELGELSSDLLATAYCGPVEAAMATETAAMVAGAVARLPTGQRTVLVLRLWNGLSYSEIAETVGRTEATVRSHMFHALAAVRKYLEPRMRQ